MPYFWTNSRPDSNRQRGILLVVLPVLLGLLRNTDISLQEPQPSTTRRRTLQDRTAPRTRVNVKPSGRIINDTRAGLPLPYPIGQHAAYQNLPPLALMYPHPTIILVLMLLHLLYHLCYCFHETSP
ncbi:hypothetical protein BJY04DRAFT_109040 [Aspergillus karnatakaensis]|uniref:uncharacterized protein n=1 Tax=Aspergillus karnatakaensis TaxID=1810916 RepID=UPI003CCDEA4D